MLLVLLACSDYAVERSRVEDEYTQTDRGAPVDVLWVIDDSGTMFEEQVTLAAHASAFADVLAASTTVDFNLAITTTDPGAAGALVGTPWTNDTPSLTDAFVAAVTGLGSNGDRDETGLDAALAGGAKFGAATDDLAIVVYSDEDDHSTEDVDTVVRNLGALRAGRVVQLDAIVGDLPDGCYSTSAAADPGERYIDVQEATAGLKQSICAADTDASLSRVAHSVLGLQTTFALTQLPVLDSLTVRVDGALIHEREVDGWSYDAATNSVVFDGWAVPQPGADVVLTYWDWKEGAPDTGG